MTTATKTRAVWVWHYSGDVNIEHGGMFYNLARYDWGYVSVVRVVPCADAGGPGNCYWVESLTVNMPNVLAPFVGVGDTVQQREAHRALHGLASDVRSEHALICVGWDDRLDEWDALTAKAKRHALVDAYIAYGYYDTESSIIVSIGPPEVTEWTRKQGEFKVDTQLSARANLRKFVRARCGV